MVHGKMKFVPSTWMFLAIVFTSFPTTRAYKYHMQPSHERVQHHVWNNWSSWSRCTESLVTRLRDGQYREDGSNEAKQEERRTCIGFKAKTGHKSSNQTVKNEPSCTGGFDFMFTLTSNGTKTISCYMIGREKVHRFEAEKRCRNLNSTLVSIETAEEQYHLEAFLGREPSLKRTADLRHRSFWTSGQKIFSSSWRWDGLNTLMEFQNWAPGQPLKLLSLYVFLYSEHMQWKTTPFPFTFHVFICEKNISP